MEKKKIEEMVKNAREYFQTGGTLSIETRLAMLKKLKENIIMHESEIIRALKIDLGKSDYEAYMCEIGMTLSEISYMIKNVKKLSKPKKVRTPMSQFPSKSYLKPSPHGVVLIMSPWNYPFLLTMEPLVDAIAAGNVAIVKPSDYSPSTTSVIDKIIKETFSANQVSVVLGGREENGALLDQKFDFIFFTGSQNVGKVVLRHAAETLTPAVLELGGKSPCIVDETANIKLAAKRIVFGKFLNCGQTCVAPDYVVCHKSVKEDFIKEIKNQIKLQFGDSPINNPDYGKIISKKHFERLCALIGGDVVCGGKTKEDTLQIEPTIMDNVAWKDKIMEEEIFGPILPILTYTNIEELYIEFFNRPKPLAFYIFSSNRENVDRTIEICQFGGGCVNDTIMHLVSTSLPFGGVGESGMGSYHGEAGFKTFSHTKSILNKKTWMDLPMRYQPYDRKKHLKTIKKSLH